MSSFFTLLFLFIYLHAHELHSDETATIHRGQRSSFDSGFPSGYEIVVPRKVKSDGAFVSHQIPHHFKRSLYEKRSDGESRAMSEDDAVHYRLRLGEEEHHLELYPSRRLCGPAVIIEEHRSGKGDKDDFLDDLRMRRMRDGSCHYQGRVRDNPGVSAVSTCYGLVGYIRTKRSWYTIEPVKGHDFTKEAEHPHVVYERNPEEVRADKEFLCNVTGDLNGTIAKRSSSNGQHEKRISRDKKTEGLGKYTVELLVVLDRTLLLHHQEFDVENYVLTLFNMAAGLFHDISLGLEMDLTIVRIIRLEEDNKEMNLGMSKDPETTLNRFQEWQRLLNPIEDTHPNHHDLAILLTKLDFCVTRKLCGFTGMSTIGGACDPLKGAIVVKDSGLQTGFHIAHHIGHSLGMSHDGGKENSCPGIVHHRDGFVETSVMYPGNAYVTKKWSQCSRHYLRLYIEAGMGRCLEDEPQDHHFPAVEMLPGVIYNGDFQCRLRYRWDAVLCDLGISCETLRCAIPGKGCVFGKKPPAEGTPCAEKRWCYNMKCVVIGERLGAIDGGWSGWSAWSRCSRTCGSGVAYSTRKCDHPAPSNGGTHCPGIRKRHRICATNPCENDAPSFRDVQCAEFNDWIFPEDGKIHRWLSYTLPENLKASENPCALYCLSDTGLVTSLRPKVVDGTTCYRGIRDICVAGVCREIPCDLNMESNAVEDVCGICRGDSTSCKIKEGTITLHVQSKPRKIVDVPAGSRNIRVEETLPTKSRIMVEAKNSKSILVDGNHLGMFEVPGSKAWLGMIRPRQEALNIPGPVTEDLLILVNPYKSNIYEETLKKRLNKDIGRRCKFYDIKRKKTWVLPKENVTVKYSLGLKQEKTRKAKFSWGFIDWEACSAVCGPGEQISKARCLEETGGLVDETFCKNLLKPSVKVRPCNHAPCLPRWMIGDWQGCDHCTSTCQRTRAVKCVRPIGHAEQDIDIIPDSYCQGPKPRDSMPCETRKRRTNENPDEGPTESSPDNVGQVKRGELVIDNESIKNLTLTIILERDENNNIVNFPKDFLPRPPENDTEFTLLGMDAVKYIQSVEEEARATPSLPPI